MCRCVLMYRTNVVRQNGPLPFPQSHPLQSWRRGLKRYCLASLCPDDTSLDEEQESIPPQPFHPISSPDVAEPAGGYMSSATSGIESPLLNLPFLRFYDHNGNFKGENKCARIQNILLKDSPEFPFVELGVSHFHFCMFGRGAAPCDLVKIHLESEPRPRCGIISRACGSVNLQCVIDQGGCPVIEAESFSEQVVIAILVCPSDAHGGRYMVERVRNPSSGLKSLELIMVDIDVAFLDPLRPSSNIMSKLRKSTGPELQSKCVLFCMDQMRDRVPLCTRLALAQLNIPHMLNAWVAGLVQISAQSQLLFADQDREEHLRGLLTNTTTHRSTLFHTLTPPKLLSLARSLEALSSLCRTRAELTNFDLLKCVWPDLASEYEAVIGDGSPRLATRIEKIFGAPERKRAAGDNLQCMVGSGVPVAEINLRDADSLFEGVQEEAEMIGEESCEVWEAEKVLQFDGQGRRLGRVLREYFREGDGRGAGGEGAAGEILHGLPKIRLNNTLEVLLDLLGTTSSFPALGPEHHQDFALDLYLHWCRTKIPSRFNYHPNARVTYRSIRVAHCLPLTDKKLMKMAAGSPLESLCVRGCARLTAKGIAKTVALPALATLRYLDISNTALASFALPPSSNLRHLVLDNCKHLRDLSLPKTSLQTVSVQGTYVASVNLGGSTARTKFVSWCGIELQRITLPSGALLSVNPLSSSRRNRPRFTSADVLQHPDVPISSVTVDSRLIGSDTYDGDILLLIHIVRFREDQPFTPAIDTDWTGVFWGK